MNGDRVMNSKTNHLYLSNMELSKVLHLGSPMVTTDQLSQDSSPSEATTSGSETVEALFIAMRTEEMVSGV